ncbi:MAG TPA: cytochrome c [Pirellulales bacterium]|jgi:mono/diheme cytochrome c family protein
MHADFKLPRPDAGDYSPWPAMFLVVALTSVGCQQKMADQPSFRPDEPSSFFADGTSSRRPVAGTVARGHLRTDVALYFGRRALPEEPDTRSTTAPNVATDATAPSLLKVEAAQFADTVDEFPFSVTRELVEHGRNRYMIYCVVCHDAAGTGQGKIVQRGYTRPPSYHIDRLREAPVGYLYRVVAEGYGSMPSYAGQIPPRDRWAIVSYVRALQLSQHFPLDNLPEDLRRQLDAGAQVATVGGAP